MMKNDNRTDLPDGYRAALENHGMSMDDVRIHYNTDHIAPLGAFKYTKEIDIKIAPGQEKHLPYEPGHVVQQRQGRILPTEIKTPAETQEKGTK